jgi:hypothetical protein
MMPLIMICYLFAFFDRINISFAKFQLQGDLGLSDTAYGLGASSVRGRLRAVRSAEQYVPLQGRRAASWIARIMISWGLATTLRWCSCP